MTPAELLASLVRALPPGERLCLRYHLAAQTPVLCGPDNELWEGRGGGTPWALAGSRHAGQRDVWLLASVDDLGAAALRAFREWNRAARAAGYKSIIEVMDQLTEAAAVAAMEEGLKGGTP